MTWLIVPARSSGSIRIGASRAEVRRLLGEPSYVIDAEMPGDYYPGVHVSYGPDQRCVVVEVWPEVAPMLDHIAVLDAPYIDVVRRLRRTDPLLAVDSIGALSLQGGVGVSAPDGIDAPEDPAATVIVFAPGLYDEVIATRPVPHRIAVRASFAQLSQQLEASGWAVRIVDAFAPLVAGEPEAAEFRRGDDRLPSRFDPVAGLRWLDLDGCAPATARELATGVPQWAAVDGARALTAPADDEDALWGLTVAEILGDPRLSDHVARYRNHPRAAIAEAAARASAALERGGDR